jgi:ATP-dependent RNA helicase DHX37/DHR1
VLTILIVVLEAEDIELGTGGQDLALDVDDGLADEDPEALDSDEDDVDDIEESDCECDARSSVHIYLTPAIWP